MIFDKQWRINRIRVKLAGAEAALRMEVSISKVSDECYPIVLQGLSREVAELTEKLRQLEIAIPNFKYRV